MGKTIKDLIISLIAISFSVAAIINIITQFQTLAEARKLNADYQVKITKLEAENKQLIGKISYATSSAFIQQQMRDKFGLGTANDYWIKLPIYPDNIDLLPREYVTWEIPVWQQWWNLFTRQ